MLSLGAGSHHGSRSAGTADCGSRDLISEFLIASGRDLAVEPRIAPVGAVLSVPSAMITHRFSELTHATRVDASGLLASPDRRTNYVL
jgi:hypothetical protein